MRADNLHTGYYLFLKCNFKLYKKKKRNREKNLNDDTNEDTNNVIFNLLIRHELYIIYYYIKLLLICVLLNILV